MKPGSRQEIEKDNIEYSYEMFTKIIQNTDHQPQTGIRVNDFQLSEEKNITDIVVKKESSSGSKK